jgi:hypothetical protein
VPVDEKWTDLSMADPGERGLYVGMSVAVDADGCVFTTHPLSSKIHVFQPDGKRKELDTKEFDTPESVDCSTVGSAQFNAFTGEVVFLQCHTPGLYKVREQKLERGCALDVSLSSFADHAHMMTVDPRSGNVLVSCHSERSDDSAVLVVTAEGEFVKVLTLPKDCQDGCSDNSALAMTADGKLLVASSSSIRVCILVLREYEDACSFAVSSRSFSTWMDPVCRRCWTKTTASTTQQWQSTLRATSLSPTAST